MTRQLRILTGAELLALEPAETRGQCLIEMDTTPIKVRGEELHPILWRGRQWAVTDFGIEALDGTYTIEAARLVQGMKGDQPIEAGWILHIGKKSWVDQDDFVTAFLVALALHGIPGIRPERIRDAVADLPMLPPDETMS